MKLFPAALLLIIIQLSSCSEPAKKDVKAPDPVVSLSESDIFSGDIVTRFSVSNPEVKKEANSLFLQAIEIYRNEKDPFKAVDFFVKSICKNPESQTYYEMANALADGGNLDQAIESYKMAEKLGYEPFSKVLYNLACVYSLKDETEISADYLESSLQAGYSNLKQIETDKDLNNLRKTYSYRQAIENGTKGMSNPEQIFWLQFKRDFASVKSDFALNGEKRQYKDEASISYDYESYIAEMRNEKFSREVGRSFFAVAEVPTNSDIVALIYAEEDAYGEDPWIVYRLATFDKEGKILDKKIIAGIENPEKLLTAKFSKGTSVTIKEFDIKYQKDPIDEGFEDNKIVDRKLSSTKKLTITQSGNIEEAIL